jgi:ribosome-associated heat shock protein Hsp15
LAQKLATSGRVRVNRDKTENAARPVKIGDVLTIALDSGVRVLRIAAMATRRGPAAEAQLLYEDLAPPLPARGRAAPRSGSRPTKRERRNLDKVRETLTVFNDDFPSRSE